MPVFSGGGFRSIKIDRCVLSQRDIPTRCIAPTKAAAVTPERQTILVPLFDSSLVVAAASSLSVLVALGVEVCVVSGWSTVLVVSAVVSLNCTSDVWNFH